MDTALSSSQKRRLRWRRRGALLGGVLIALIALFYSTYAEIAWLWWNNSSYNHCLLVVPIAFYLGWLKRDRLSDLEPDMSWLAMAFLMANAVLWLVGALMSINVFQHVAAVGFIVGSVWMCIGWAPFRLLLFPLLYLYFGVPEGEVLVPYLQDFTAEVVVKLLRVTDIPVYLEGRYLTIPSGHFHVAKACSGINYLIATLAVGTVFAYLRYRSWWRRAIFMLLAILVPLAANGARAYGIVMIAHLSDYKYAMGVDHFIYGWVFFGVVIFVLFAIGDRFSDVDDTSAAVTYRSEDRTAVTARPLGFAILVTALILFGAKQLPAEVTKSRVTSAVVQLPRGDDWQLIDSSFALGGEFAGAHQHLTGRYGRADDPSVIVDLEVYFFRAQTQGAEIINIRNDIFHEDKWRRLDGPVGKALDDDLVGGVFELKLRNAAGERLVWYWYDINGLVTNRKLTAKIEGVRSALVKPYFGEAVTIVSTPIVENERAASGVLEAFIADQRPTIATFARSNAVAPGGVP